MGQQEYLDQMLPKFNDTSKLAELVVQDLYDTSRYSIIPKFIWLKVSYSFFWMGNVIAIAFVLLEITQNWH